MSVKYNLVVRIESVKFVSEIYATGLQEISPKPMKVSKMPLNKSIRTPMAKDGFGR